LRTLATPEPIKDWSLTSLRGKLIKIGAKVVSGRYVAFQMAEVAIPRNLFADILRLIGAAASAGHVNGVMVPLSRVGSKTTEDLRLDDRNLGIPWRAIASRPAPDVSTRHGGVTTTFQSCQSLAIDAASIAKDCHLASAGLRYSQEEARGRKAHGHDAGTGLKLGGQFFRQPRR
jgi:hypothetical protein